jgi:hypothetical protein
VSTYAALAGLPVRVEGYELEVRALTLGPGFERLTTVVTLHGAGEVGVGEDVCYDPPDHVAQAEAGAVLPVAGAFTLAGLACHLDELNLFPAAPPSRPEAVPHRRWAFESAALDLALRQAGVSLAQAIDVAPQPVTFVVSTRLGEPPTATRVRELLGRQPSLRFKLDPTDTWTDALMEELSGLGVVAILDMKGCYDDVPFEVPTDPCTYRRAIELFADALIEDPKLTPELRRAISGHEDRITWDAPIRTFGDIRDREWTPRMINVKPSRFGRLSEVLAAYDYLRAEGIGAYGGGQTELGPGRGQIQYLASLFHPDAPNDVAPGGYNDPSPPPGLPASPLPVAAAPTGFRWGG